MLTDTAKASQNADYIIYLKGYNINNSPAVIHAWLVKNITVKEFVQDISDEYYETKTPVSFSFLKKRKADRKFECEEYNKSVEASDSFGRMAFIQIKNKVICISLSAKSRKIFETYVPALDQVLNSFHYKAND